MQVDGAAASGTDVAQFKNSSDFSNYFCEYAKLHHQKDMLTDTLRMRSYHAGIVGNPACFKDKVVLDVGSGTGVLAIWAAQAGAKKVYAVEATSMARHARTLVASNGLSDIVEVIQGKVEDMVLPEKVDIIVSEWMGYLLVRESMLDSVIAARDKFLKPDGALYPSHAAIKWGAVCGEGIKDQQEGLYANSMREWEDFAEGIKEDFNLDVSALTEEYDTENQEYYLGQAYYRNLESNQLLTADTASVHELDLKTVTVAELLELRSSFRLKVVHQGIATALACWFTASFKGCASHPSDPEATFVLDTGPLAGETHWGQQVFYLAETVPVKLGDTIDVTAVIARHEENERMVICTVGVEHKPVAKSGATPFKAEPKPYHIQ